jgi:hypothetical protein
MMRHTPSGRPVADYIDLVDRPEGVGFVCPVPERVNNPLSPDSPELSQGKPRGRRPAPGGGADIFEDIGD